ncbi:MAG TPA: ribosome recycling factor [Thermoanaerobacterales bacterium]|nr:ribosome recycling factor [Thermoanaerobacterales bacterium]
MKTIYKETKSKMKKAISVLSSELATLRAGRATPSLVDKINVDYYGVSTPLNQLANISAPEPRLLVIQPWDPKSIEDIEKAILKSDLGITPNNDGEVIRLVIPQLTEERRQELVKVVGKKTEECKVAIRNIRRETNDILKDMEKNREISEDEYHRACDEVQKITDKNVEEVDEVFKAKENEIMEV